MHKQDSVQRVLLDYKITITSLKTKRSIPNTHTFAGWDDPVCYKHEDVQMIMAEIPEKEFAVMADALCEMKDLMRDPETAKLLMEAKFINRLKGNR